MNLYIVRIVKNGIGSDYTVMAKDQYEAKRIAKDRYPDHTPVRVTKKQ